MKTITGQTENLYRRPASVGYKEGKIVLEYDNSSPSYFLDEASTQATLLKDLLSVIDQVTTKNFLSYSGGLTKRGQTKFEVDKVVEAARSVQTIFEMTKLLEAQSADLIKMLFFWIEDDFSGNGATIRQSRKAIKKNEIPAKARWGFAPSIVDSEFNFFQKDASGELVKIPWPVLGRAMPSGKNNVAILAAEYVEEVVRANAWSAQHWLVADFGSFKDPVPTFHIGELVPDPWTAAHFGLMKIIAKTDEYSACPRPGCPEVYTGRTDKSSCGKSACRQYVTRQRRKK